MTAICGIVNFDGRPVNAKRLERMAEAGAHDPQEDIAYWICDKVGLASVGVYSAREGAPP